MSSSGGGTSRGQSGWLYVQSGPGGARPVRAAARPVQAVYGQSERRRVRSRRCTSGPGVRRVRAAVRPVRTAMLPVRAASAVLDACAFAVSAPSVRLRRLGVGTFVVSLRAQAVSAHPSGVRPPRRCPSVQAMSAHQAVPVRPGGFRSRRRSPVRAGGVRPSRGCSSARAATCVTRPFPIARRGTAEVHPPLVPPPVAQLRGPDVAWVTGPAVPRASWCRCSSALWCRRPWPPLSAAPAFTPR